MCEALGSITSTEKRRICVCIYLLQEKNGLAYSMVHLRRRILKGIAVCLKRKGMQTESLYGVQKARKMKYKPTLS
jgi:hypothetical protein